MKNIDTSIAISIDIVEKVLENMDIGIDIAKGIWENIGIAKILYRYVKVSRDLEYLIFFLKKLFWGPMKLKLRHLWLRWS